MIYGYARVSTITQGKNGNSLQEQEERLRAAGAQEIIKDTFTGTKIDRPQFAKLLAKLQSGDTLVVTKLDRFARTAVEGGQIVKELHARGVTINILNMGIADNTPMGRLMVNMLLAFAEFERDMIVERTQAGKAMAKAKAAKAGITWREGRKPKYTPDQTRHAMQLLDDGHSYTQVEAMTGISKSTLIRARREQRAQKLRTK